MYPSFQGIPNLPDLTHPNELINFGSQIVQFSWKLALLVLAFGLVMAVITWSNSRQAEPSVAAILQGELERYIFVIQKLPHFGLILVILVGGFFLCSTLANRYHHWEQQKVAQVVTTVSGERLEQAAPQVRYQVEETYTNYRWVDNQQIEEEATRKVDRFLAIAGSQIQVKIDQATDPATRQWLYSVDFEAEYQVVNRLSDIEQFFFEVRPPFGYKILQNFQVEKEGKALVSVNPGDYGFPFRLAPGETTRFRVTYQAQGAPRWVYEPMGQLLSNFRLTVNANFPNADFAGVLPTVTQDKERLRELTWIFEGNVSVRNPLGVFTATDPVTDTGILPRLLLLAPAIFLWWILLLNLSLPLSLRDVAIAAGIFFACLLTLTYSSRLIDAKLAFALIYPILIVLVWGLGKHRQASLAAVICTIAGVALPIFGLLIPYSGLTLSLAGLLSGGWLAVQSWYKLWNCEVSQN
ncbi:hypothetical protein [Lyngbya sp. PCC 8106]|uniref:hypothetical protein n=1 Tax=Lyngbya sp. (strain PCC 8106) TaxID=313612 RepID=UPI0000EAD09F|nr:hypothetical protein [Lyngbya sp. PCC 8106]EAW38341.1 hypothetical protein L8106_09966 [Lyngbya sp. PCC 8106]